MIPILILFPVALITIVTMRFYEVQYRSAIHMNISIIGEATNRILKTDSEISISNAKQIVGTRNYLIHGYDSLRLEMIWAIVVNDLPKLKHEVISLLNPDKNEASTES